MSFEFLLDLLCNVYCVVPKIAGYDMIRCLKGLSRVFCLCFVGRC